MNPNQNNLLNDSLREGLTTLKANGLPIMQMTDVEITSARNNYQTALKEKKPFFLPLTSETEQNVLPLAHLPLFIPNDQFLPVIGQINADKNNVPGESSFMEPFVSFVTQKEVAGHISPRKYPLESPPSSVEAHFNPMAVCASMLSKIGALPEKFDSIETKYLAPITGYCHDLIEDGIGTRAELQALKTEHTNGHLIASLDALTRDKNTGSLSHEDKLAIYREYGATIGAHRFAGMLVPLKIFDMLISIYQDVMNDAQLTPEYVEKMSVTYNAMMDAYLKRTGKVIAGATNSQNNLPLAV